MVISHFPLPCTRPARLTVFVLNAAARGLDHPERSLQVSQRKRLSQRGSGLRQKRRQRLRGLIRK